ncbi:MAG: hypothetical protein Q7K57_26900 [Burkholderiaceae bacterium]|nr:hypothetical protein [Burkholderiaceae bacterium]
MIVLKETQDKVLSYLQSIIDIVELRYLPTGQCADGVQEDYEPNKIARATADFFRPPIAAPRKVTALVNAIRALLISVNCRGLAGIRSAVVGFFSASKANLRNAP